MSKVRTRSNPYMNANETVIVPLNHFDSDVESLELDKGICLRRILNDEPQKLREAFPGNRDILRFALTNTKHVLEMSAYAPINDRFAAVKRAILALKLLKPGDVTTSWEFSLDKNGGVNSMSMPSLVVQSSNPYFLKKGETEDFIELWRKLRDIEKEKPYLSYPLYQFTKVFEEKSSEDKIVEYMTLSESLVFYGEETPEPAGKVIGIAIGMLIGRNQEERDRIKATFTSSYTARNLRVHGNTKKFESFRKKHDIGKLSLSVEECIRRVLRKLIEE